jgi:nucleoside-triphosphatase
MNIFLTGKIGAGKSTAIRSFLRKTNLSYGGFETKLLANLVVLSDLASNKTEVVAKRNGANWEVIRTGFEGIGKAAIERALAERDIVVMDELGRFELDCKEFQKSVFSAINSDRNVLGVLKNESNPFLDKIRSLKEIVIMEVTEDNREFIPELIEKNIRLTE